MKSAATKRAKDTASDTTSGNKYPVKSLIKTLSILEYLGSKETGCSLAELSSNLRIGKSTVHRLLGTLRDYGFVWLDPHSVRYMLGARILQLRDNIAVRWGEPTLSRLAETTGETCNLAVLEGTHVRYLIIKESRNPLRMSGQPGKKLPAHATALGKALLSGYSRAELLQLYGKKSKLETFTPNTISSISELANYLERSSAAGIFVDNEEMYPGVICLAAPVRNAQKQIVSAVSISFPKQRSDKMDEFRSLLLECTRELSDPLRYGSDGSRPAR
jgi:DNA-binding IclR family transcriptional regulator